GLVSIKASFYLKPIFGVIILIYIILNMLYSVILKHIVIVDVMVIAAGFMMRVMAGAELIDVYPSKWLILCTILLSLFLAFGKRRNEIMIMSEQANNYREVLKHYNAYFLDQMIAVVMAATLMAYMLYTVSEETVNFFGNKYLIWTIPFVLYGIFRYFYLVHKKEKYSDPAELLLRDLPLLVDIILWLISCVIIIYYFKY
ncbi:MAG: UbiA prenyltransferase family protein, partial [Planctomycetota bacterium]